MVASGNNSEGMLLIVGELSKRINELEQRIANSEEAFLRLAAHIEEKPYEVLLQEIRAGESGAIHQAAKEIERRYATDETREEEP